MAVSKWKYIWHYVHLSCKLKYGIWSGTWECDLHKEVVLQWWIMGDKINIAILPASWRLAILDQAQIFWLSTFHHPSTHRGHIANYRKVNHNTHACMICHLFWLKFTWGWTSLANQSTGWGVGLLGSGSPVRSRKSRLQTKINATWIT